MEKNPQKRIETKIVGNLLERRINFYAKQYKGMTQKHICELLGTSTPTFRHHIRDGTMTVEELIRVAGLLGTTPESIIKGVNIK